MADPTLPNEGNYFEGAYPGGDATEAINIYTLLKRTTSGTRMCDAGEVPDGWAEQSFESGDPVTIRPLHTLGVVLLVASGAFGAEELLYPAANGQVEESGDGEPVARSLEAATAQGDYVMAVPFARPLPAKDEDVTGTYRDDFIAASYSLSSPPAGWAAIDTSAAGTPTIGQSADAHGGAVELAFDNTDEAQAIGLDHGDELLFDIDQINWALARFRAPTLDANDEIVIGLISDQNDAPASITEGVWLSVDGAQDIEVESDDGTTRNDDLDTGKDLGNDAWADVYIDLRDKSDVKVYVDVDDTGLDLQSSGTTLDLSDYSGNLQPILMLTKSGGTQTTNLDVDIFEINFDRA